MGKLCVFLTRWLWVGDSLDGYIKLIMFYVVLYTLLGRNNFEWLCSLLVGCFHVAFSDEEHFGSFVAIGQLVPTITTTYHEDNTYQIV